MTTKDNFLPADYKLPQSDWGYMKFKQWQNKFRILWSSIIWWEYFNTDNKPQRSRMNNKPVNPTDIKKDEKGNPAKVKHFWAFPVYNYQENAIQILELTQSGIMGTVKEYIDNAKRGNPMEYDIIVNKTWEKLETEYTITVDPKENIDKKIIETYFNMWINLEALFDWWNPFEAKMPF